MPYVTIVAVFLNCLPAKPAVYQELSGTASQFLMIIVKVLVNHFFDFH